MERDGSNFAPARLAPLIDATYRQIHEYAVIQRTAADTPYDGRHVDVDGRRLLNFGGCSYLGLEQRRELHDAAIDAIRRYGTQFSFSRSYLQSPLYARLESALGAMTGGHALVTPSTTLAHVAALPLLIEPGDGVVIDQFAHASMYTATALLRGVDVAVVRHNRMDMLERKLRELTGRHRRVWYLFDGLYSMRGDLAPLGTIAALRDEFANLHLYADDAHATSWMGTSGRGHTLEQLTDRSRLVVALSLNKAFSAAGGALVFPTAEERDFVRTCSGPMIFSGPVQPPMLAAAVASAELHLGPDFGDLQGALRERIDRVHELSGRFAIGLAALDATPIFFVRCGPEDAACKLVQSLAARGFYACVSTFPAVPRNQAGVRFTVSTHHTLDDVEAFVGALTDAAGDRGTAHVA
jgi:7-keto-8-aminopelargonate synthetase-like enzyme